MQVIQLINIIQRLCLTLHTNEGSYLAHTQGKKHQSNLLRRKAREGKDMSAMMHMNKHNMPKVLDTPY